VKITLSSLLLIALVVSSFGAAFPGPQSGKQAFLIYDDMFTRESLIVSQLFTLPRTCRSDRKAGENQQLRLATANYLLLFSSSFSRRFAAICHN
jgi:hypothetical protein